jgi:hypothetical protein
MSGQGWPAWDTPAKVGVNIAGPLVGHAVTQIVNCHAFRRNVMIDPCFRDVTDDVSALPQLIVQPALTIAQPGAAVRFRVEAAHLKEYLAPDRHVEAVEYDPCLRAAVDHLGAGDRATHQTEEGRPPRFRTLVRGLKVIDQPLGRWRLPHRFRGAGRRCHLWLLVISLEVSL